MTVPDRPDVRPEDCPDCGHAVCWCDVAKGNADWREPGSRAGEPPPTEEIIERVPLTQDGEPRVVPARRAGLGTWLALANVLPVPVACCFWLARSIAQGEPFADEATLFALSSVLAVVFWFRLR